MARLDYEKQVSFDETGRVREKRVPQVDGFQTPAQLSEEYFAKIRDLNAGYRSDYAIPTGYIDIDRTMGGLSRSRLTALGGLPSIGKSTFAVNLALNAAKAGIAVAFFSVEMEREWVIDRMVSVESGVYSRRLFGSPLPGYEERHTLNEHEDYRMSHARGRLDELPIYVDDQVSNSEEIHKKTKSLKREVPGLGMVVVDRLEILDDTRLASARLKDLAKSEDLAALLVTSQLMQPVLDGKKVIQFTADTIIILDREEMRDPNSEKKGIADVYVIKSKTSPEFTAQLLYLGRTGKFLDLEVVRA